jgi:alkylation response protein AidB-like acyl-CoA dehydrogenase
VPAELFDEATTWVHEHWDPELTVDDWWRLVAKAGWSAPHFTPEQGGRGLSRTAIRTVRSAFNQHGALMPPGGLGMLMAAPTILAQGNGDQIARHVPGILDGQDNWCQLFSEPGAGSDLAGLTTRAERDGDRWIINGQKVWSSLAHKANRGMLLARTNFDAPKHQGISWFAFSMDQPGVTVRPLRESTGDVMFNEVFFDDAVVEDADLIGGEGNGWAVTQTTLYFERTGIGAGGAHSGWPEPGSKGGMLGRRAGDAALDSPPGGNQMVSFADLASLAKETGCDGDPLIRQKLALLHTYGRLGQWNAQRAKATGAESIAQIGKISQTRIVKLAARLGLDILGADGMLAGPEAPYGGRFPHALVFSSASSIYGGTDEIQRNIIAERALGLPREPMVGKGQPYGEVLRSIGRS